MYTVKQVSDMMSISVHTIRFYDKERLFPYVERGENLERLFSDEDLLWVQLVQCLRLTGMPLADIRHYVELCQEGDCTIPERHEIMVKQKEKAELEAAAMQDRVKVLEYKVGFYQDLLDGKIPDDSCNPMNKMPERMRMKSTSV